MIGISSVRNRLENAVMLVSEIIGSQPYERFNFGDWEESEVQRFDKLPSAVKGQVFEYYSLLKAMEAGHKLDENEIDRLWDLVNITIEHDITPFCLKTGIFGKII